MKRGISAKPLSVIMSIVLAIGLMPLPAFAAPSSGDGGERFLCI